MRPRRIDCATVAVLLLAAGCAPTWHHDGGKQKLYPSRINVPLEQGSTPEIAAGPEQAGRTYESLPVSFIVPNGWHWVDRGDGIVVTKDGIFLQHLFIERIHIMQSTDTVTSIYPFSPFSFRKWPVRTAKNLKQRFFAGMGPADAAEVLLDSRRHDTGITGFQVQKVITRTVAGRQAFRAVFEFRLAKTLDPSPLYRSVYCGFMDGDWFYGVSYTAAARYYFDRDIAAFEAFLESFRLIER